MLVLFCHFVEKNWSSGVRTNPFVSLYILFNAPTQKLPVIPRKGCAKNQNPGKNEIRPLRMALLENFGPFHGCLRVAPPPEALRRAGASAKAGPNLRLPNLWSPRAKPLPTLSADRQAQAGRVPCPTPMWGDIPRLRPGLVWGGLLLPE